MTSEHGDVENSSTSSVSATEKLYTGKEGSRLHRLAGQCLTPSCPGLKDNIAVTEFDDPNLDEKDVFEFGELVNMYEVHQAMS